MNDENSTESDNDANEELYQQAREKEHQNCLICVAQVLLQLVNQKRPVAQTRFVDLYKLIVQTPRTDLQYVKVKNWLVSCCVGNCINNETAVKIIDNLKIQLQKSQVMPKSQSHLAKGYASGFIVPQNDVESFEILQKSNYLKNPEILRAIGKRYEFGWGVEKDISKAITYYMQAADAGVYEAIWRLHMCKEHYRNIWLNYVFQHFEDLERRGNNQIAEYNCACCYYYGIGVKKNPAKAVKIWQRLAAQSFVHAISKLGVAYEYGNGVAQDRNRCFQLYQQAAQQGHREAQYNLGLCYANGIGVERNLELAANYFQFSADQGYAEGANRFALCCETGEGVQQDPIKAFQYYQQTAVIGMVFGQYNTGRCYMNGIGTERDYARALYWLRKAQDQNYGPAIELLMQCKAQSRNAPVVRLTASQMNSNHQLTFKLAQLLSECGNNGMFETLGDYYFGGIGVEANVANALRCYERVFEPRSKSVKDKIASCRTKLQANGQQ